MEPMKLRVKSEDVRRPEVVRLRKDTVDTLYQMMLETHLSASQLVAAMIRYTSEHGYEIVIEE